MQRTSSSNGPLISIASEEADPQHLASFFVANLSDDYISHSELQGFRAIGPRKWARNVEDIVRREIRDRLASSSSRERDKHWKGIIVGHENTELIALAFVSFSRNAAVPYGTLEDVIIDKDRRGKRIGERLVEWIIDDLKQLGIRRIFLESGHSNRKAHEFFERLGFRPVSVVMAQDLEPGADTTR